MGSGCKSRWFELQGLVFIRTQPYPRACYPQVVQEQVCEYGGREWARLKGTAGSNLTFQDCAAKLGRRSRALTDRFSNNIRQPDEGCPCEVQGPGELQSFPTCLEMCQISWVGPEHFYSVDNEGCLSLLLCPTAQCVGLLLVGLWGGSFASLSVLVLNNLYTLEIFL